MHMIHERGAQQSRAQSMEPYSPASNSDTYHLLCILALIFLPDECKVNSSLRLLQLFLLFQTCFTKSFQTICYPIYCSLPGSSVCGISQARILEWVAISFSRGSSWPRDQTHVSCFGRQIFTTQPPGKPVSWEQRWCKCSGRWFLHPGWAFICRKDLRI